MFHLSVPLFYPFTLGMLAAVNPCGFPLLPAYLDFFAGGDKGESGGVLNRSVNAVTASVFSTLGFVAVFGILGGAVQLGWSGLYRSLTVTHVFMVVLGVAMVAIGGLSLIGRPLQLHLPEVRGGVGLRKPWTLTLFGVSYGLASIGCALPLFVGGVASSFGHHSAVAGIAAMVAYAMGMGIVFGTVALAVAILGPSTTKTLRRFSRVVPTIGGVILVVVGLYTATYWLSDIIDPTRAAPGEHFVTQVQSHVANFLNDHITLVGAVMGAALIIVLTVGRFALPPQVRAGRRARSRPTASSGVDDPAERPVSTAVQPQPEPVIP